LAFITIIYRLIPRPIINKILLTFPFLYRTKFVNYENHLTNQNGIKELLEALSKTLYIEGDIIECGTARCGTTVIMADYLSRKNNKKKIYACDSFSGFDLNELKQERKLGFTNESDNAFAHSSYSYVKKKIERLGFSDTIVLVKGLFQETLPSIKSKFSLALIDCDLKKSTIYAAEMIWPNLSSKAIMLFDDYTSIKYKGAKEGIDFIVNRFKDEIEDHGILNRLYYIHKN